VAKPVAAPRATDAGNAPLNRSSRHRRRRLKTGPSPFDETFGPRCRRVEKAESNSNAASALLRLTVAEGKWKEYHWLCFNARWPSS
jgi:hypothetical protein